MAIFPHSVGVCYAIDASLEQTSCLLSGLCDSEPTLVVSRTVPSVCGSPRKARHSSLPRSLLPSTGHMVLVSPVADVKSE